MCLRPEQKVQRLKSGKLVWFSYMLNLSKKSIAVNINVIKWRSRHIEMKVKCVCVVCFAILNQDCV
jgi:hypothetical protein